MPRLGAACAATAAGAPAALSDDAGTHLCNQVLYLALEAAERAPGLAVTFLHLPLLPEQIAAAVPAAARAPAGPRLSLAEMKRAVTAFLRHTGRGLV